MHRKLTMRHSLEQLAVGHRMSASKEHYVSDWLDICISDCSRNQEIKDCHATCSKVESRHPRHLFICLCVVKSLW